MTSEIIRVEDVSFSYAHADHDALSNLSFTINQGEWVAIIGPNGSGKSTMAKVLNGLLVPYQGSVYIKGIKLSQESVWDIRRMIGMVFQNPDNQFVGATVEDDVAFGLENNGIDREEMRQRIHEALKQVRMEEFIKKEPAKLSGGQKQRVAIAGIIALRPDIIILDESTAMLDPLGREEIIQLVHEVKDRYGVTVLSITHDIDEASLADRILVMKDGQLQAQDIPAQIFQAGRGLIEMGLDLPFSEKVRLRMQQLGVDVPDHYLDEEGLIEWLSQSYLKM